MNYFNTQSLARLYCANMFLGPSNQSCHQVTCNLALHFAVCSWLWPQDNKTLASCDRTGSCRLWDRGRGEEVSMFLCLGSWGYAFVCRSSRIEWDVCMGLSPNLASASRNIWLKRTSSGFIIGECHRRVDGLELRSFEWLGQCTQMSGNQTLQPWEWTSPMYEWFPSIFPLKCLFIVHFPLPCVITG
jgi:hypothetical protein